MLALIDGDIVRYRTGFASNDTTPAIACWRAGETIEQILRATGSTEYRVYLSDSLQNNYRYAIYPGYKASRQKQVKPLHHEVLKDYLMKEWGATVTLGQEADDALGINQTDETVICSIDKDLLQVPGSHYNWVKNEYYEQNWLDGLRRFYEQCLSGDRTDDISGLQGIGEVKARRALAGCETEEEMFEVVRGMWGDDVKFLQAGQLLWVRRKDGELWEFPFSTQDTELKLPSSKQKQKGADHYSERGSLEKNGTPEVGYLTDDMTTAESPDSIL